MAFALFYVVLCLVIALIVWAFGLTIWSISILVWGAVTDHISWLRRDRQVKREASEIPDFVPDDWDHS